MSVRFTGFGPDVVKTAVFLLVWVTAIAVFTPFEPWFPASGIDASWIYAVNEAVAKVLVFGKDVVFTFGPYASIYTKMYHPATDSLMLFGGLYLAICYALLLTFLMQKTRPVWAVAFCFALACKTLSRDPLLLSYPLLLAVAMYRMTLPGGHPSRINNSAGSAVVIAVLFSPLGLLPLIKGSLLPICGAIATLNLMMFWHRKQTAFAVITIAAPAVSAAAFWLISGQPFWALPAYLLNMAPAIAGYTEAMSVTGSSAETGIYVVAAMAVLYVAATASRAPAASRIFLGSCFAIFLFIVFKNGFVRYEQGHVIIAGLSILLAALLLPFVGAHRHLYGAVLLSLAAWACIGAGPFATWPQSVPVNIMQSNVVAPYESAISGMATRIARPDALDASFGASLAAIRKQFPLELPGGSVDIYSFGQSYLLASGAHWSPRPVLQSYSTYTPSLARLNAAHVTGEHAPDNLLFKVEPIDQRLPALEDGLSWPIIIDRYMPVRREQDYILLTRTSGWKAPSREVQILSATYTLGERIALPASRDPVFAEIDIRPTPLGRLTAFLYKPSELSISVETIEGKRRQYRFIPGMARSGFLLSPLVADTDDFAFLFGGAGYWSDKRVTSITIGAADGDSSDWDSAFDVRLSTLQKPKQNDMAKLFTFDTVLDVQPAPPNKLPPAACDGAIDAVDGRSGSAEPINVANVLSVEGWLAVSAKQGAVPDAVEVFLADENGHKTYFTSRRTPRPDVSAYFSQTGLSQAGFKTIVDVSALTGRYTVGLARSYLGKLENCPQFNTPVIIGR